MRVVSAKVDGFSVENFSVENFVWVILVWKGARVDDFSIVKMCERAHVRL